MPPPRVRMGIGGIEVKSNKPRKIPEMIKGAGLEKT
jgi:hypothetical protein